jgi:hypothetical protein
MKTSDKQQCIRHETTDVIRWPTIFLKEANARSSTLTDARCDGCGDNYTEYMAKKKGTTQAMKGRLCCVKFSRGLSVLSTLMTCSAGSGGKTGPDLATTALLI